jgi:hypothetical protein
MPEGLSCILAREKLLKVLDRHRVLFDEIKVR